MSGLGTSTQTSGGVTTTNTSPFAPVVQPETNLVGSEQNVAANPTFGFLPNSSENAAYTGALGNLNFGYNNNMGSDLSNIAQNSISAGGDPQGLLAQQRANLNPIANANLDPTQTPGMANVLKTIQNDVSNNVNSQFAGAGRSLSGLNQQAIARGISQGEAQPLLAQYNQNVQNTMGANQNLGAVGGQYNTNLGAAGQLGAAAPGLATAGDSAILALNQQQRLQPYQTLGVQENLLNPIAGLGGTVVGQGAAQGSQTASPLTQFGQANSALGSGLSGGLLGIGGFI